MTAIGLCFGGGQILVGCTATVLVLIVLVPLKNIDAWLAHDQKGRVTVKAAVDDLAPDLASLTGAAVEARFTGRQRIDGDAALFSYELRWKSRGRKSESAGILAAIEARYRVECFEIVDGAD